MYNNLQGNTSGVGHKLEEIISLDSDSENIIKECADKIAEKQDADVLLFNGSIVRPYDQKVIEICSGRRRKKNVILMLVSHGGDADAAFRIARCLQKFYTCYIAFIPGYCKSAATLVTLGAHALIFGKSGELGPLDVQMVKPDSLWENRSGLTVTKALEELRQQAFDIYEHCFLEIQRRSGGRITAQTASDAAILLVESLLRPISEQIDPMHIGEVQRVNQIGLYYGLRLDARSDNLAGEDAVKYQHLINLVRGYPSHGFVIDIDDARAIFRNVVEADQEFEQLSDLLKDLALVPITESMPKIEFLSTEIQENCSEKDEGNNGQDSRINAGEGRMQNREVGDGGIGSDPQDTGLTAATSGGGIKP